jgi:uncharacterized membrane protein YeaQ/YmgE (transglycosylase-associated protein family)
MDGTSLLIFLIVGALAGWLAGVLVRGFGFGLLGNIIVGIIGAFLGGWLFRALGVSLGAGLVGVFLTALIGAVVLLFLISLIRRA